MSAVSPASRPLLQEAKEKLAAMDEHELMAVNRFLKRLEMLRLRRSLGKAVDESLSGEWQGEVEAAIRDFRRRHPY